MKRIFHTFGGADARAGCMIVGAMAAGLAVSTIHAPGGWALPVLACAAFGFASARPADAVLAAVAFAGFTGILNHLVGVFTFRAAEFLVVASIGGCCLRAALFDPDLLRAIRRSLGVPLVLFGVTALASLAVQLRVSQVLSAYPGPFVRALWRFLSREYFTRPDDFLEVVSTAVLLEGLALYVVVVALCRRDDSFFERALRMLAVGGAGLGLMSLVRLGEILLRNPHALSVLRAAYGGVRISPQIPDYIAAGSYFGLCWLVSLGLALNSRRNQAAWLVTSMPIVAALYLTGSRSVLAAAAIGLGVLASFQLGRRVRRSTVTVVVVAVAVVVTMFAGFATLIGRDVAGDTARQSLTIRMELAATAVRVVRTHPVFGVGIDRFYLEAGNLASPELNALWPGRKNAHNDFLRIAAELGLTGAVLFLWILGGAAARARSAITRGPDARVAGLIGGMVAYFVTMLFSNPLMVHDVSYVFWAGLGLVAGYGATRQPVAPADAGTDLNRRRVLGMVGVGALLVSVPVRADRAIARTDLRGVSYGVSAWTGDKDGRFWRVCGRRATFFVDGRARFVEIPLAGTLPSGATQTVALQLDGRPANTLAVGPNWQVLRMALPETQSARPWRIDLVVSPTWTSEGGSAGAEGREVGVKIGQIAISPRT